MRFTDLVTPVSSSHRNDGKLGQNDGSTNGSRHFLGALDTKTDVASIIANSHEGLEPGSLTGTGLLLHRHDLQDFVFQRSSDEEVNDLALLKTT